MTFSGLKTNPFIVLLFQLVAMGATFLVVSDSPMQSHIWLELILIASFSMLNNPTHVVVKTTLEKSWITMGLLFLTLLLLSVFFEWNYYYYKQNAMWLPLFVLMVSLFIHYKFSHHNNVIRVLAFLIILYSGGRELLLWFVFLHLLKYVFVEQRRISVRNVVLFLLLSFTLILIQYTSRTKSAEYSMGEVVVSVERTLKRIAYPIFVSDVVFESEPNKMVSQRKEEILSFFIPSLFLNQPKIIPGREIQHVYFDKESKVNLPVTFSGQSFHYFGSYWAVGLVIFLFGIFVIYNGIRIVMYNQISVSTYLIVVFFLFRYDHGLYIINNVFKIVPLVIVASFIIEKTSFVKTAKNLTY